MATISLVIRTYNAMAYWAELLQAIKAQTLAPDELLVIDSESTDATVEAARKAGARLATISQKTFTHARSTNLGFQEARGDWVVMLSQDALPGSPHWLANLVAPLRENESVAAVFGRQIPKAKCFPLEAWEILRSYPDAAAPTVLYSNVNSVARKVRWLETPFDEQIRIAEDRYWALSMQGQGFRIAYEPSAAVIHSHRYSLREMYERCRQEARASRDQEGTVHGMGLLVKAWPKQSFRDGIMLAREGKLHHWPRAVGYRFAQFAGMIGGGSH